MDELVNAWVGGRTTPFQMGLLAVFEPGPFAGADGSVDVDAVARELSRRASGIPELRRRILWTHPGEGPPVWVQDNDDLAEHVVTAGRATGPDIATWAANRTIQPLRRDRPLWRADVIAQLPGGRFAVLVVVHHLLADGLAGMRLLAALLDAEQDAARPDPQPRSPNPLPSHWELLSDNMRSRRRSRPRRRAHRRSPREGAVRAIARYREAASDLSGPLPQTSLPRVVGPSRRMSVAAAPLHPLRATAHAQQATINDLLLEAVTHGLRDLLTARGECRESMFVRTIVPVALDRARQAASLMVVDLPVGEPDPARRLAAITERTRARKARLRATLGTRPDLLSLPVPVARVFVPWARRRGSARIHLSVTNVPGPPATLWFAGARLVEAVPVPPLVPLVGLTVAALSYTDRLTVAANADGAVRDLDILTDGITTALTDWATDERRLGLG
jgi:WS/DGAT/MGAT family acyltransferase